MTVYVCVFMADPKVTDDVVDIGNDPDFSLPVPTWGICRPNVRLLWPIDQQYIIFIGHYREKHQYIVKGWFKVRERITYPDALECPDFRNRPNLIIRLQDNTSSGIQYERTWRRKDLGKKYSSSAPSILREVKLDGRVYVQNPRDTHEVDNWKCRRIFFCPDERLDGCLKDGCCSKEKENHNPKGYVVADTNEWCNVGPAQISWDEVAPEYLNSVNLRNGGIQHNVRKMKEDEFKSIKERLEAMTLPVGIIPNVRKRKV